MFTLDGREFIFRSYDSLSTGEKPDELPGVVVQTDEMVTMTCVNHPEGKWTTKNPYERHIHWLGWRHEDGVMFSHPEFGYNECPCPFRDLRVVV
jgi:hypothetical protein